MFALLSSIAAANPISGIWYHPTPQEIAIPTITDILPALPLFVAAIAIELVVSYLILRHWKLDYGILKTVLAANIISISIVWAYCFTAAPFFRHWYGSVSTPNVSLIFFIIISAEAFAVAFEAFVVHYFNKKNITLAQATGMALAANMSSFILSPGLQSKNDLLPVSILFAFPLFLFAFGCYKAVLLIKPGIGAKKAALITLVFLVGASICIAAILDLIYIHLY